MPSQAQNFATYQIPAPPHLSHRALPLGEVTGNDRVRIVARIAKDHEFDLDFAARIFGATRTFLALAATFPGNGFVPSKNVDKGWHTFLLYTTAYAHFCASLGLPFIHHEPSDGKHTVERGGIARTVRFMEQRGIEFDPALWATLGVQDCTADPCSCTGCSEWD